MVGSSPGGHLDSDEPTKVGRDVFWLLLTHCNPELWA